MTRTSTRISCGAADALERLLLQEPQQLGLERRHHLGDFVEEHRAAVGALQQAALLQPGVGERATLVTEQLALEELLGQGGTRDVHERPRRPIARVMNHLGNQILAGAAFAGEEHGRRRAGRDPGHQVPERGHRRRCADDALEAVGPGRVGSDTAGPRAAAASSPAPARRWRRLRRD